MQTSALPLGYAAVVVERETGFEPATSTLARLHSTTELLPLNEELSLSAVVVSVNPKIEFDSAFFTKVDGVLADGKPIYF